MKQTICWWHPSPSRDENVYVLFKSEFVLTFQENVVLSVFGTNFYRAYINGVEVLEGPARFEKQYGEYDQLKVLGKAGTNTIAIMVHSFGIDTRFSDPSFPPFVQCEVQTEKSAFLPLKWLCREETAYLHLGRRVNAQVGWTEWCDTRLLTSFTDLEQTGLWVEPIAVTPDLDHLRVCQLHPLYRHPIEGELLSQGEYTNRFGYENDDPPARFILRNLRPDLPAEGVWYRFDLGLIGLYRPVIEIDVPADTIVEIGYSEALTDGRVLPYITLSASASCHLDRWICIGGKQKISTFNPRGFRFLEVHIAAPKSQVKLHTAGALQRSYFADSLGSFKCSDSLLNRIWQAGVDTLKACSEDALTDTPTRERGQWLGDAVVVGMETLSVAYGDLSLIKRSLQQAAYCRHPESGVVGGLYPGQNGYLSSYALLWVSGCLRYVNRTGDIGLLREVYDSACRTVDAFLQEITDRGVKPVPGIWDYVDWGHVIPEGHLNAAINMMLYGALRELATWERMIGEEQSANIRDEQAERQHQFIAKWFALGDGTFSKSVPAEGEVDLAVGYHATVLALWYGLVPEKQRLNALKYVKQHILNSYPNQPDAPRLSHPAANDEQLITPYFSHFSLHVLMEADEEQFVLDQYRRGWGEMLELGATTLMEVFDQRWSHCHAWSACPSWQLSRHILGIWPDLTSEGLMLRLRPRFGDLQHATGRIPILDDEAVIEISWSRTGNQTTDVEYYLRTDRPIVLQLDPQCSAEEVHVDGTAVTWRSGTTLQVNKRMTLQLSISDGSKL